MKDRGIKKWIAYKSLPEQYIENEKMKKNKNKISKPKLSSEEAELINYLLLNHNFEELIFVVFQNGELITLKGIIKRIDEAERKIIMSDRRTINLKDLVGLKKRKDCQ